ncbi:helix-turn-helix domain-containing protein [Corallococcus sp. 4LFB]|uniref:helix-turn-helix domain-containing protein n=1 Tax=Corallococcus sp. 4LFB TaxID=3383249 RepID=UPI0039772143
MRTRSPLRLSLQEREEVSRCVLAGESMRSIARPLGHSASTVSRTEEPWTR